MFDTEGVGVFLGLDVGKGNHHAVGLDQPESDRTTGHCPTNSTEKRWHGA